VGFVPGTQTGACPIRSRRCLIKINKRCRLSNRSGRVCSRRRRTGPANREELDRGTAATHQDGRDFEAKVKQLMNEQGCSRDEAISQLYVEERRAKFGWRFESRGPASGLARMCAFLRLAATRLKHLGPGCQPAGVTNFKVTL
jgi:hypothetical protein